MDITLTLTLVAVFGCVALVIGSITSRLLERSAAGHRRVEALLSPQLRTSPERAGLVAGAIQTPMARKVAAFLPKSPKEMTRLGRRLAAAGYHGTSAAVVFSVSELGLAAAGFLAAVLFLGWSKGAVLGGMFAMMGYMVPAFVLHRRINARKKEIGNGLADALDLLIVSIEAGLGIDQAIVRCADELEIAYPSLAEELRMVNVEGRAGKPRIEAFRNFAERTKVDDVRALVAMLVQTDRFGTSIAQALRIHAEVSRTKRRQRAEERAAKIGVKLVFPLVFCLFPAFYAVTLGPAIVKFVHAFGKGGYLSGGFQ